MLLFHTASFVWPGQVPLQVLYHGIHQLHTASSVCMLFTSGMGPFSLSARIFVPFDALLNLSKALALLEWSFALL